MYFDTVVVAGVGTVLLMFAFMGGFAYFVYRDAHKVKRRRVPAAKPRQ